MMHFVSYCKELNSNNDNIIAAIETSGQYILIKQILLKETVLPTGDELGRRVAKRFVTKHTASEILDSSQL